MGIWEQLILQDLQNQPTDKHRRVPACLHTRMPICCYSYSLLSHYYYLSADNALVNQNRCKISCANEKIKAFLILAISYYRISLFLPIKHNSN